MSNTVLAVTAGLGAACAYGVASAVQHDQAGQVPSERAFSPGLLVTLSQRPVWLLGMVVDVLAVALQTVALRFGSVALVQFLVVGGLPIAVLLSAAAARRSPNRRQLLGLLLTTAGIALAVPVSTTVGLGHSTDALTWIVSLGITTGVVALLLLLSTRRPDRSPLALGLAAGITAGASSVLLAICAARLGDPLRLLTQPAPYAAAAFGFATLLLSQQAFQTGSIGTPLAALSVAEPGVAVILAVTVLHQSLPHRPTTLLLGAMGVAAAVAGVLTLAAQQDPVPARDPV
jgi:hypothetical protein